MESEEYILPTPTARIIGIVLIVCGVLALLLIQPFSELYVRTLGNIQDIDQSRKILIASCALPALLFAALTSWLMTLGHRTISLRHWPPHGLPILYRTRKHSGNLALTDGVICFFAGGFTGLIAVFWFFMAWKSYNL